MDEPGFEATVAQGPAGITAESVLPSEHRLPLRFTGSGSEYFRIWIVNLLLTLLTLTLYYPWAKVRRLRYFYGNTLVGDHPLGFHANPMKMLRGYLLVAVMLVTYSVAGNVSPLAGLIAFLVVAAIWPALLKSSMQFRLANTSWRGLRFRFRGSVQGAYAALLPFFLPGLIFVAALVAVPDQKQPPIWYVTMTMLVMLATFALIPWLWWRLKKYQHDHFAYGPEQTELRTGVGSFYGVFAETMGIGAAGSMVVFLVLGLLVAGVAVVGVFAGVFGGDSGGGDNKKNVMLAIFIGVAAFVVAMFVMQLVPRPYFTAKMQNLIWTRTASHSVGFVSTLRFWPLLGLTLKNWLLMVVTLGLYWPFAAVALHRMRVQAVTVVLQVDPQTLADEARQGDGEAAGDAAGDLFGLDVGL